MSLFFVTQFGDILDILKYENIFGIILKKYYHHLLLILFKVKKNFQTLNFYVLIKIEKIIANKIESKNNKAKSRYYR